MIATRAAALFLLLTLTACAGTIFRPVHEAPPTTPAETVQHAMDEFNVLLSATASTLTDDYKGGFVSETDFESWRAKLNKARDYREEARKALAIGDPTTADGKLKLAQAALDLVKEQLAKLKKGTKS
jgi:hypothetical protein